MYRRLWILMEGWVNVVNDVGGSDSLKGVLTGGGG